MIRNISVLLSSIIMLCISLTAQSSLKKPTVNGKLLLLGGGITQDHADLIYKFARSDRNKLIVIPSALDEESLSKDPEYKKIIKRFKKLGFDSINIIHATSRKEANSEAVTLQILDAYGVCFLGGSPERLRNLYANTETQNALANLLDRGGIIVGTSAGSGIQASYIYDSTVVEGFNFLNNTIVINHFLARNRQFEYSDIINQHPNKLAIGIDDNTGILIDGDQFEVVGKSYVGIYNQGDSSSIDQVPSFYLMKNGERFNLKTKSIEKNEDLIPKVIEADVLQKYIGHFKAIDKDFSIETKQLENTLLVYNSWGWDPYPIYYYGDDIFFATNRNMWFQFTRDQENNISGLKKMRSIIQEKVITEMIKN